MKFSNYSAFAINFFVTTYNSTYPVSIGKVTSSIKMYSSGAAVAIISPLLSVGLKDIHLTMTTTNSSFNIMIDPLVGTLNHCTTT